MEDPTTATLAVIGAVTTAALVFGVARFGLAKVRYDRRLRTAAILGRGRVVEIEHLAVEAGSRAEVILDLEVHVAAEPVRAARANYGCLPGQEPQVGDWMTLRIHPDHPKDIYVDAIER